MNARIAPRSTKAKPLTLWEKLSYGGGDIANCITFGMVSCYLSYYYTDVAGIPLAATGIILGVSRLVEALANFLTGAAIDRTNSSKSHTKPFLYFTTIPLIITFVIVFAVPEVSTISKTAFAFISYTLFCLLYAVNNTAFGTMMSTMTSDANDRRSLNNFKVFGCGLGTLAVSFCTLPLISHIGVDGIFSYAPTALIFGVASLLLLGNCTISCQERIPTMAAEKLKLRESLYLAAKSRAWILLCIVIGIFYIVNILRSQSILYYAKYVLEDESSATLLLTVYTLAMLTVAPFMDKLLNRLGSRNCLVLGFVIFISSSLGIFFAEENMALLSVLVFVSGVGGNLASGPSYVICADAVDEVEQLTGKRPQGLMTSFMMCIMKAGVAAAGALFTVVLNIGGYSADALQQSAGALTAIRWDMIWLPALLSGICLVICLVFGVCFEKDKSSREEDRPSICT